MIYLPTGLRRNLKRYRRVLLSRLFHQDVQKAIVSFGVMNADFLMVHTSLSGCGHISGGPQTVIDVLQDWVAERTLAMPTHTYCYPNSTGLPPVFDPYTTPSVVGSINDHFWKLPEVVRSIHPTHSIAARGPLAQRLCAGHDTCDTPCGKGSPYQKLVQGDCSVLMFATTMNTYTLFHTAEDEAGVPYLYEVEPCRLLIKQGNGSIKEILMRRQNMAIPRRFAATVTWLEGQGQLVRRQLGLGEIIFIPRAKDVHKLVMIELQKDPWFLCERPSMLKCFKTQGVEDQK